MKYRAEIDGLRAFAVLSVVGYHYFPHWVPGGFIGVDIFFVISGFLITSIILKSLENQTFDIFDFYGRRIRRIFPALILIMLTSLAFGWFALLNDEYSQLGKHIFGGTLFISNFIYWDEAIGYLTNSNETKPMLHLWSLAIEEQFYLCFPLILSWAWKNKLNKLTLFIAASLASFYIGIVLLEKNPINAFFLPFGRFWELLVGSLLAYLYIFVKLPEKLINHLRFISTKVIYNSDVELDNRAIKNVVSFIGLLILISAVFYIKEQLSFPGYWALVPTIGAFLIILGKDSGINRIFLMNPVSVWFGLISYPLYLWHWSVLSFLHIMEGDTPSREVRICAVAFSVFLAWITYIFIERPLRFKVNKKISTAFLTIIFVLTAILAHSIKNNEYPERLDDFYNKNGWALSQVKSACKMIRENKNCRVFFPNLQQGLCVMKNFSDPTVLLFGDSHAHHLYDGLASELKNENLVMLGGGWGGKFEGALNPLISKRERPLSNQIYQSIIKTKSIHTVIIAHNATDKNSSKDYIETFDFFTKIGKKVIYIIDIPKFEFEPTACFDSRPLRLLPKTNFKCSVSRQKATKKMEKYRAAVFEALDQRKNIKYMDTFNQLCDKELCSAKKNGVLLYSTSGNNPHLSLDGSNFIGKKLAKIISN